MRTFLSSPRLTLGLWAVLDLFLAYTAVVFFTYGVAWQMMAVVLVLLVLALTFTLRLRRVTR
jgi:hypothetical protein